MWGLKIDFINGTNTSLNIHNITSEKFIFCCILLDSLKLALNSLEIYKPYILMIECQVLNELYN